MNWGSTNIFFIFLLLFPLIWWGWDRLKERKQILESLRYNKRIWRGVGLSLLLGCMICCLLALAQPRGGFTTIEVEQQEREVVVVLDLSRSMWAVDQSPSRMERARRELMDIRHIFKGERVGLVFFAEGAFARMPLTKDYALLGELVSDLDPEHVRSQGSDIASALELASELFTKESSGGKAILLISDGEDHSQKMKEATELLREKEIPVFIIGVGTEEGGRIPLKRGGFLRDRFGQVVVTTRKTEALREIAEATQGAYVSSLPGTEDLVAIYEQGVLKMTESSTSLEEEGVWEELFLWPLSLGTLLLVLSYWPLKIPRWSLPLLFLFCSSSAFAESLSELRLRWADEPNNLELAEKLSYALLQQGEAYEARLLLERIASEGTAAQRERALFNAGLAAYKEGSLDSSAQFFQRAVEEREGWNEAEQNLQSVLAELARRQNQQQQQQQQGEEGNESQEQQEGEQQEGEQQEGEQQEGEQQESEQQEGEQREDSEAEKEQQEGEPQQQEQEGEQSEEGEDFAEQSKESAVDLDQLEGAEEEQGEASATSEEAMRVEQGEQVQLSDEEQLLESIEEARPRWIYGEGLGGEKEW